MKLYENENETRDYAEPKGCLDRTFGKKKKVNLFNFYVDRIDTGAYYNYSRKISRNDSIKCPPHVLCLLTLGRFIAVQRSLCELSGVLQENHSPLGPWPSKVAHPFLFLCLGQTRSE